MPFINTPEIQNLPKGRYRLKNSLTFQDYHDGAVYVVPKGFESDGATGLPRCLERNILSSSFLHDWLFEQDKSTAECNAIFYRSLLDEGINFWYANILYGLVNLGGGLIREKA